jgi:predicted RNase H-like HicB family nuclease
LGAQRFIQKGDDYEELTEAIKEELHQWIETHPQDGGN